MPTLSVDRPGRRALNSTVPGGPSGESISWRRNPRIPRWECGTAVDGRRSPPGQSRRLSSENPLFSEILRADGPLVVYDLERLPRLPHTVVLAACESGRSVVRTGDELLGLSATFLAGGTAQLLASVVPVPDADTAPLMVAFHRRLAAGQAPAHALADAQQRMIDDDRRTLAASAGFVCIGSGVNKIVDREKPGRHDAVPA